MNASANITEDYENKSDSTLGENKPNSNPIFEMPKMNVNSILTQDYENEPGFAVWQNKPNQSQFPPASESMRNSLQKKSYEKHPKASEIWNHQDIARESLI